MTTLACNIYSGLGNTFVISESPISAEVCHKFGVDGLLILTPSTAADYKMEIINKDGSIAACCGNGLRCAFHYLYNKGLIKNGATIESGAGLHQGFVHDKRVKVELIPPKTILKKNLEGYTCYHLDTGVPHLVLIEEKIPFHTLAPQLRNHPSLQPEGANVNWVRKIDERWTVTTYERGVEGITKACGTGLCASALVLQEPFPLTVYTDEGLPLTVTWEENRLFIEGKVEKAL